MAKAPKKAAKIVNLVHMSVLPQTINKLQRVIKPGSRHHACNLGVVRLKVHHHLSAAQKNKVNTSFIHAYTHCIHTFTSEHFYSLLGTGAK